MNAEIRTPQKRTCTDCGREEYWDKDSGNWRVVDDEVGDVYCIHSWDITGNFSPIEN